MFLLFLASILATLVVLVALLLFILPFVLAQITIWRDRNIQQHHSSCYIGRVWHTRHLPKKHAFTYPLFIFGIDLDESENINKQLWPLSIICQFRSADHLKNGEGLLEKEHPASQSLRDRVAQLVLSATQGNLRIDRSSHRILLVTHLAYYGYCFNPVSFYYIIHKHSQQTHAIVAEVSNTPWNEMYCYVLHPSSSPAVKVQRSRNGTNYIFSKAFHVSPFMEMDYTYDWVFDDSNDHTLRVVTGMKRQGQLQFSATMKVHRTSLHPYRLAWQMARYPMYTLIIQLWIHLEAFVLFCKGIEYQAHPRGSETWASRAIGQAMTPFFQLQEWWKGRAKVE